MIRVNLLPPEMAPQAAPFNPTIPVVVVGLGAFAFVGYTYHNAVSARDQQRDEITRCNAQIKQLEPIIAQVEQLEAAKAQLTTKKGVIQSIESERLRYPMFMDDLVRLLPGNVWLTNLTTVIPPNAAALNVTMQVTALDNYAVADLISNLESSQIFSDVEIGTINASATQGGGQTLAFQITTTYKKTGAITDATKKP